MNWKELERTATNQLGSPKHAPQCASQALWGKVRNATNQARCVESSMVGYVTICNDM
jgi:hypothetical protein